MTARGVSSDEETIIFYRMNDNSIELQKTTWGTIENITINNENDTRVTITIGCVFTIRPTIIVLDKNSTKCTLIKTCDIQLKTVGVDDNKLIEMPDKIKQLNFMHTKEPYTAKLNKYKLPTITTTNKTITTEKATNNITKLNYFYYNTSSANTNNDTISRIGEMNTTPLILTNITNITDGVEETVTITNNITNNTTNVQFVTNPEDNKFRIRYYNFVLCVGLSILLMTIVLTIISIHHNIKCVNRHRYKYIANLIQEQSIELNVMKESSL